MANSPQSSKTAPNEGRWATLRLFLSTGVSEWYGVVNAILFGISAVAIAGEAVTKKQILVPYWGYLLVLNASILFALYRTMHPLRLDRDSARRELAVRRLDPKHEADLRGVIDRLLTHPGNLDTRDQMLLHDLEVHLPSREIWSLRKERGDIDARSQQTYKAYADQLTSELDRLDFGLYRQWVEQVAGQRRYIPATTPPPWEWNCMVIGDVTVLRLNNWPIARVTTMDDALAAYDKVMELWDALPTWKTTKALWEPNPRFTEVKKALSTEIADLKLSNFAGTGPCEHC
jgi:hypothetical protein